LTVVKVGTGTGTVTSSPAGISCGTDCNQTYAVNTVVTLAATPAAGSVFAGWSGACTGTAPCKLTMAAAKNVTATFNRSTATYSLTVAKAGTGTGTVTSSPAGISCGTDCNQTYAVNTVVTLAATPAAGSVFAGWSGACTGTASCKVTMAAAKSVTATFNKPTGPDLIVAAVSSPPTGKVGGTITVSVTFKNQGVATAQNSLVEFLFSKDATITLSDIGSSWGCYTGALAAGGSIACSGGIGVPANLAPGTYYLGAYADKTGIIAESNETNNGRAAANTIVISQ
jgi:Fe-S cluster biogenesis protein NfuA